MKTYPNAPIAEALLDIRVSHHSDISAKNLEDLHLYIKEDYPEKEKRRQWEGTFSFRDEKVESTSSDKGVIGYFFRSADDKQVVQYRLDGFTFSRLKPYQSWDHIFSETKKLWDIYESHLKPVEITRQAVRYINLIEIPAKKIELNDFFTAPPRIPDDLPQAEVGNFFSQITVNFPETETKSIITTTIKQTNNPNITPIVLDIDVFKEVQLKPDNQIFWEIFEQLRYIKNEIFDKNLKEETKALFR